MNEFWQAFLNAMSPQHGEKLFELARLTEETAARMNITAHKTFGEICVYHILDSISVSREIKPGAEVCDVGTGGGFPGLALAVLHPETGFTLLDATEKKIRAVEETANALGLTNVRALQGRAEELGVDTLRDRFDLVVSRAVAPLPVLAELCLPLIKAGGAFCAMKGPRVTEEIAAAKDILQTLFATERECRREACDFSLLIESFIPAPDETERSILLDFSAMERYTLIYDKTAPTPAGYPRSFARIKQANRLI